MDILEVIVVIIVILLALWRRDIFLYCMAAPVAITTGLMWRGTYNTTDGLVISIGLVGIGLYCLIKGIENIIRRLKG